MSLKNNRISLIFLFVILIFSLIGCSQKSEESDKNNQENNKQTEVINKELSDYEVVEFDFGDKPFHGVEEAPISIVLFGDFECPYCNNWSKEVYPIVEEYYIDKGLMKIYFYDLFFVSQTSKLKALISMGVEKQNPNKLIEYHKLVNNLTPEDNGKFHTEDEGKELVEFLSSKIEEVDFGNILEKINNQEEELILGLEETQEIANKSGVTGTPTVFVNGMKMENSFSIEELNNIILKISESEEGFELIFEDEETK